MPLERCKEGMHRFTIERVLDISNVSGIGSVAEGIVFSSGQCVVHWLTPAPHGSLVVWNSFQDFRQVHIDSHPENKTRIHWYHSLEDKEEIEE